MKTTVEQLYEMIEKGRIDDIIEGKAHYLKEEQRFIENAFKKGYLDREKIGKFRNSLDWYAEDYYYRIFFKIKKEKPNEGN